MTPKFKPGDTVIVVKSVRSSGKRILVEGIEEIGEYEKQFYPESNYWCVYTDNGNRCRWSEANVRLETPLDKLL